MTHTKHHQSGIFVFILRPTRDTLISLGYTDKLKAVLHLASNSCDNHPGISQCNPSQPFCAGCFHGPRQERRRRRTSVAQPGKCVAFLHFWRLQEANRSSLEKNVLILISGGFIAVSDRPFDQAKTAPARKKCATMEKFPDLERICLREAYNPRVTFRTAAKCDKPICQNCSAP